MDIQHQAKALDPAYTPHQSSPDPNRTALSISSFIWSGFFQSCATTFGGADHVSAFLQERLDVLRVGVQLLLVQSDDLPEVGRV